VKARLDTGVVSRVGGLVTRVDNLLGSAVGGDTVYGTDRGGVLVTHLRNNMIQAGIGRTILIGGDGINTLIGNKGDDLILDGRTSYDADYAALSAQLRARAKAILSEVRHNTIYFPNLMVKGPIQLLRLFKPISAGRTLVESWTFRLVGAPDRLLERTLMYNRLINAPTSVVGHDDLEVYERAQQGLVSNANPWVNLQRLYEADESGDDTRLLNGTTELQMRNQFRAWEKFMQPVVNAP
jgi:Ca2+-binding RTX toxin-like protein